MNHREVLFKISVEQMYLLKFPNQLVTYKYQDCVESKKLGKKH